MTLGARIHERFSQLRGERLIDIGKCRMTMCERGDAPALDIDAAMIVISAGARPNSTGRMVAREGEHALDHTLQTVLKRLQTHIGFQASRCARWRLCAAERASLST